MKKHASLCCLFVSCMLLPGCAGAPSALSPSIAKLLGPEISGILQAPDRIESFRISAEMDENAPQKIGEHTVLQAGPILSTEQAHRLAFMASSETSYVLDASKRCPFLPTYGFRLTRNAESFSILVAPGCALWRFEDKDRSIIEDFDPAADTMKSLLDELFPQN
ncbi:MAG TPA: hypothetical protein DCW68_03550 [Rhodospirillaceae bacterium]|nr:MAG: hypothetical protein A2018_07630 [Alphaproteobacteria bacterium GWF2_58_20]HAU29169.1 hypothetical protein [Rhodospirillaceae bacterium]